MAKPLQLPRRATTDGTSMDQRKQYTAQAVVSTGRTGDRRNIGHGEFFGFRERVFINQATRAQSSPVIDKIT